MGFLVDVWQSKQQQQVLQCLQAAYDRSSSSCLSRVNSNCGAEASICHSSVEAGSSVSVLLIDDLGFMPQGDGDVPATDGFFG
jgi:hypothetical protein